MVNSDKRKRLTKPFQSLWCAIPNSDKGFTFRAGLNANQRRDYLTISSKEFEIEVPNLVDKQSVHSVKPRAYLTVVAFCGKLSEWILRQKKNGELMLCQLHASRFKEKRPTEELRRIICGILESVSELHENNSFHGNLDNLDNFAFSLVDDYCGRGDIQHVEVTLLNASVVGPKATKEEIRLGRMKDLTDLHKLILTTLLGFTAEDIAEAEKANKYKLQKKLLPSLTGDLGYVEDLKPKIPREFIYLWDKMTTMDPDTLREYPGFWHGDRRFHYYARLLNMVYADTDDHPDPRLSDALVRDLASAPWINDVTDKLLLQVLNYGVKYEDDMLGLAKFAKAVTLHINKYHSPHSTRWRSIGG